MDKPQVELKKERDLGQVINATFAFIAQEIKPLSKIIGTLILPLFLIMSILSVYLQQKLGTSLYTGGNITFLFSAEYWIGILFILIFSIITHTLLIAVVYNYMKIYVEKGTKNITTSEIIFHIREWFWRILGTNIAIFFLIMAGIIVFIIPGIYMAIPLSLITAIMVFEDIPMSEAFSRCFKLTKDNWWRTFGLLLLVSIIVYSIAMIIIMPLTIINLVDTLHSYKSQEEVARNFSQSTLTLVTNSIQTILTYIASILIYITLGIMYFNLREKKEKPSLADQIEKIE